MRYLSVCSGIEAASCAWHPLGWKAAAFSEIEKFPRAVLAHHYPDVPLHGDFTTIRGDEYGPIDLLVGGTPCQDFSVAGLRAGLDGERGNLTLEFVRLADRTKPRWVVWENVPGVLSIDGGRAFGAFLGGLAQLGYGFAYRVLDAQYFNLAQRRARVFVVAHLGDWRRAAAVLFERESLRWDSPPRREAGEGVASTISARTKGGGGLGTDFDCDGGLIQSWPAEIAPTLNAHFGDKQGLEDQHALSGAGLFVMHSLRADGGIDREDRHNLIVGGLIAFGQNNTSGPVEVSHALQAHPGPMGRMDFGSETFLLANAFDARQSDVIQYGDRTGPLDTDGHSIAIAFSAKDHGADAGEIAPTLRSGGHDKSHANGGVMPAVAFDLRGREGGAQFEGPHDTANVRASSGGSSRSYVASSAVRRLTPRECERLQGFPDDYTLVPYRGKPAADGSRYKALGNSMAVPVMSWIGRRIALVEQLCQAEAA